MLSFFNSPTAGKKNTYRNGFFLNALTKNMDDWDRVDYLNEDEYVHTLPSCDSDTHSLFRYPDPNLPMYSTDLFSDAKLSLQDMKLQDDMHMCIHHDIQVQDQVQVQAQVRAQVAQDETKALTLPVSNVGHFNLRTKIVVPSPRPCSDRAKSLQQVAQICGRYSPMLPFLNGQKPVIKNENNLFSDVSLFVDACMLEMAHNWLYVAVGSCAMPTWDDLFALSPLCFWFWTRLSLPLPNKTYKKYDVYVQRGTNPRIYLVDFVSNKDAFSEDTLEANLIDALKQCLNIRNDKIQFSKIVVPILGQTDTVPSKLKKKRSRRENNASKSSHPISVECERNMWSLIFVTMTNYRARPPIDCIVEFLTHEENSALLLQLSIQSILYFLVEHDQLLEKWMSSTNLAPCKKTGICSAITDVAKAQAATKRQFVENLFAQTNRKSLLALRKQGANRVGKLKGRRKDGQLCITLNQCVGAQLTFDNLFTTSLFALFVEASKIPIESDLAYDDLVRALPFVFPQSFDALFGSNVCITTPYLKTADPMRMFGPISNLLWPDLARFNVDTFVSEHLKTYKLEVEIHPIDDPSLNIQESVIRKFIDTLRLGPSSPWQDLTQWTSVVDAHHNPLGIYFCTQASDIFGVCGQVERQQQHLRLATPMPDNFSVLLDEEPGMRCMRRIVYQPSGEQQVPNDSPKINWDGSKTNGFVVRRFFATNAIRLKTFSNLQSYVQKEQKGVQKIQLKERLFAILDVTRIRADPGYVDNNLPLLTFDELRSNIASVNLTKTLFVVDDIGKQRCFVVGNIPRLSLSYRSCEQCQFAWPTNVDELPSEQVLVAWYNQCRHFHMSSTSVSMREVTMDEPLTETCVVACDTNPPIVVLKNDATQRLSAIVRERARSVYVGAISNPTMSYVNTWNELRNTLMRATLQRIVDSGCVMKPLSPAMLHFSVTLPPRTCLCCNASVHCCLAQLALLLLYVDMLYPIQTIATTIDSLIGCTIRSEPFQLPVGLRCVHDWTKGTGDISFQQTFQKHENISPCGMFGSLDPTFSHVTTTVIVAPLTAQMDTQYTNKRVLFL